MATTKPEIRMECWAVKPGLPIRPGPTAEVHNHPEVESEISRESVEYSGAGAQ